MISAREKAAIWILETKIIPKRLELTSPIWEALGSEDVVSSKRWLAFLEGGLLPVISLTSLHFFTKYNDGEIKENVKVVEKEITEAKINEVNAILDQISAKGIESLTKKQKKILKDF